MDKQFWIVANNSFPTRISYKHTNYQSATAEAKRLARMNKGERFVVMEAIQAFEVDDLKTINYGQDILF